MYFKTIINWSSKCLSWALRTTIESALTIDDLTVTASVAPTWILVAVLSQFCPPCTHTVYMHVFCIWMIKMDRDHDHVDISPSVWALYMIYLLYSSCQHKFPGANQWKYFCLFTQYPNSPFRNCCCLHDSDSVPIPVPVPILILILISISFSLAFAFSSLYVQCVAARSMRFCFRFNNWTIN